MPERLAAQGDPWEGMNDAAAVARAAARAARAGSGRRSHGRALAARLPEAAGRAAARRSQPGPQGRVPEDGAMPTATQARLFHRLTSHAPERPGTGWPLREVEEPRLVTSFRSSDSRPAASLGEGLRGRAAGRAAAARAPAAAAPAVAVLAGTAPIAPARSTWRSSRGCCTSRRASCGRWSGRTADLALPRRGLGGRAVPARALRRRAGGDGAPRRRALVPPRSTRCVQVGPPPARRDARRSSSPACPWRTGLALPRARLPPRLLGRGHDALAAARRGRLARG